MNDQQRWKLILARVAQRDGAVVISRGDEADLLWAENVAAGLRPLDITTTFAVPGDLQTPLNIAVKLTDTVRDTSKPDAHAVYRGALRGALIAPDRSIVGQWTWSDERAVVEIVECVGDAVLAYWAEACGFGTPAVVARYKPGADSALIARIASSQGEMVAKVGPTSVINTEVDFMTRVHEEIGEAGTFFPRIRGHLQGGSVSVVFMDAANPTTLDEVLFRDQERVALRADAAELIRPFLDALATVHKATRVQRQPEVAAHVYQERFAEIPNRPDFQSAAERAFPEVALKTLLQSRWVGADGKPLRSYADAVAALRAIGAALHPRNSSIVHGDPHLKNLLRDHGGHPIFIDPRTVWDGHRRGDEGYGDVAYDYGTLLHSIWPMSTILHGVDSGLTAQPFSGFSIGEGVVAFHGRLPQSAEHEALTNHLIELIADIDDCAPAIAEARLYVGTANALVGWLRYPRALPNRESWGSTLVAALHYIELGLGAYERSGADAAVRSY